MDFRIQLYKEVRPGNIISNKLLLLSLSSIAQLKFLSASTPSFLLNLFHLLQISNLMFCLNCFTLIFEFDKILFRNPIFSSKFDCIQLALSNPIPDCDDFDLVSFCDLVTGVHFRQKYPSFFIVIYTCAYLGLMIYSVCQNELYHFNELSRL